MKAVLSLLLGGLLLVPSVRSHAAEITFETFYDALVPYGDWLYVEGYGDCWQPRVAEDWRPYTVGTWADSDDGWLWVSDEEFGWAVYHYGRWAEVKGYGWVWVPGYEWAPAWVAWRDNSEYIGWAPLPPEAVWTVDVGFGGWVDYRYDIGPSWYSFCPIVSFCTPNVYRYCLPWRNNVTFINNTVNVTNINFVNNGNIFIGGPNVNIVKNATGNNFRRLNIERIDNVNVAELRANRLRNTVEGGTFRALAPRVVRAENIRPKEVVARLERNRVTRGWDGDESKVADIRARNREMARKAQDAVRPGALPLSVSEERRARAADPTTARPRPEVSTPAENIEKLAREDRRELPQRDGNQGAPAATPPLDNGSDRAVKDQAAFQKQIADYRKRQSNEAGPDGATTSAAQRQQVDDARRVQIEQAAQQRRAAVQKDVETSRSKELQVLAQRQREAAANQQSTRNVQPQRNNAQADSQRQQYEQQRQQVERQRQQYEQQRQQSQQQGQRQQQQAEQQRQQSQSQAAARYQQQRQEQQAAQQRQQAQSQAAARYQQPRQEQQQRQQQQQPQQQQKKQSSSGGDDRKNGSGGNAETLREQWRNRGN